MWVYSTYVFSEPCQAIRFEANNADIKEMDSQDRVHADGMNSTRTGFFSGGGGGDSVLQATVRNTEDR